MRGMTLRCIADACGGILHEKDGMGDQEVTFVTTDSRQASEGCLFAAIRGAKADGHRFIPSVYEKGAICVITEEALPEDAKGSWIKVISTLQALKDIAEYYLRVMNIPVVGITGSVGKTSTKEMIAAVLSRKYRTLKTLGNFNNELGLPLTVFRLQEEDEIARLRAEALHAQFDMEKAIREGHIRIVGSQGIATDPAKERQNRTVNQEQGTKREEHHAV